MGFEGRVRGDVRFASGWRSVRGDLAGTYVGDDPDDIIAFVEGRSERRSGARGPFEGILVGEAQ